MKPAVMRTTTVREEVVYDLTKENARSKSFIPLADLMKRMKDGWRVTTIMVSFEKRDYPAFGQLADSPPAPARRRR